MLNAIDCFAQFCMDVLGLTCSASNLQVEFEPMANCMATEEGGFLTVPGVIVEDGKVYKTWTALSVSDASFPAVLIGTPCSSRVL